jgi:hypothetical protein
MQHTKEKKIASSNYLNCESIYKLRCFIQKCVLKLVHEEGVEWLLWFLQRKTTFGIGIILDLYYRSGELWIDKNTSFLSESSYVIMKGNAVIFVSLKASRRFLLSIGDFFHGS